MDMKKGIWIALLAMVTSVAVYAGTDGNGGGKEKGKKACCEQKKGDASSEAGTAGMPMDQKKGKGKKGSCQQNSSAATETGAAGQMTAQAEGNAAPKAACCAKGQNGGSACGEKKASN